MTGRSARLIGVRRLEFFHASKEGALVLFDALVAPLLAAPLDGTERALVAERLSRASAPVTSPSWRAA
jgi:hypothetical protein